MTGPPLPGETTLVASWRALARRSVGATVDEQPTSVAAFFPAWAPLNNAIARVPASDADATATEVARGSRRGYRAAGVEEWAFWIPSPARDLTSPDRELVAGLARDATTLVMGADLGPGFERHDGVVATSVATAALAGDEPVAAGKSTRPKPILSSRRGCSCATARGRGLWACVRDGDCGIYAMGTAPHWRRQGLARSLIEHTLAVARGGGRPHRIAAVDADGGVALPVTRIRGRRPLRGMGVRPEQSELLIEPDPVEQGDAVDLESCRITPLRRERVTLDRKHAESEPLVEAQVPRVARAGGHRDPGGTTLAGHR